MRTIWTLRKNVSNGIDTGFKLGHKAHFLCVSMKWDSSECCRSNGVLNAYVYFNISVFNALFLRNNVFCFEHSTHVFYLEPTHTQEGKKKREAS
jgi:hypothetical protein